jgi:hypothetical protein
VRIINIIEVSFNAFYKGLDDNILPDPLIEKCKDEADECSGCCGFCGRGDPDDDKSDHGKDNKPKGEDVADAQKDFFSKRHPGDRIFGCKPGIQKASDDDIGSKEKSHEDSGKYNGKKKISHRDLRQACQKNAEGTGRDHGSQSSAPHDGSDGDWVSIFPFLHFRKKRLSEHGASGHGGAG